MRVRIGALGCATAMVLTMSPADSARADANAIQFQEVAGAAGIDYVGRSWGSMWGDFNGDGAPDVWTVNHQSVPSLYLNNGSGFFTDIASSVIPPADYVVYDSHGAAWADFDNDGHQDLYQLADEGAGPIPDQLFVYDNGIFEERGLEFGLDYTLGRGRMPLWLDYDRDGLLDVFHPVTRRGDGSDGPTALFHQGPAGFTDVADLVGLIPNETSGSNFGIYADVSGDGILDLLTHLVGFPDKVHDMTSVPFVDVRDSLGIPFTDYPVQDAVAADFDGDLDIDLFLVRGERDQDAVLVDANTVEAHFQGPLSEHGMSFQTTGDLTFDVYPRFVWTPDEILIGSGGLHPATETFVVSPTDTTTWGSLAHVPGVDPGMFIGYDQSTQTWEVLVSAKMTNLVVTSTSPISGLTAIGWSFSDQPRADRLLVNHGTFFQDETVASGIVIPSSGRNVVAGDFDNDMDTDIYIVSTGPVTNLPNILYLNQGSGTFVLEPNAAGADGNSLGRGDAASTADYDRNGFLDVLVTNGVSKAPFDVDGPTFLFQNLGNANHWLEIDLVGVAGSSNRDGVGARVYAEAGGVVQLREQNGGTHYRGQNHQRLHFGLGANTQVDTLTVYWPSGEVQVLADVPADQILQVVEPPGTSAPEADVRPASLQLTSYPNPFHPRTTVSFSLARSQPVTLSVYDAGGRLVRRLVDGAALPAGRNGVVWAGRDDSGRRVSSGVYFVTLEADARRETTKLVVLE